MKPSYYCYIDFNGARIKTSIINVAFFVPTIFNKTVMIFLLCLAFVGQSTASMTMFYGMVGMSSMTKESAISSSQHDMSRATQDSHQMMSMSDCGKNNMEHSPDKKNDQCCVQECDCLTSGCSSVSAFLTLLIYPSNAVITHKITSATELVTSQIPTSLYRPPILS